MSFLWPEMLWLLLALPLLVVLYLGLQRRRKRAALQYPGLAIVRDAMGRGPGLRRHLPPVLLLLALGALIVAMARPQTQMMLPLDQRMVVLAMDVSGSMRAADVEPTRMAAAQAAARDFVTGLPDSTRVAVVTFAGAAALVQPPTHSKQDVYASIDRFTYQRGTAVGAGIVASLQTIFPDVDFESRLADPRQGGMPGAAPLGMRDRDAAGGGAPSPVPPGSYNSAAIILLTDGQTTTGPPPAEAARLAAERGVKVFTVGVGTDQGEIMVGDGWSMRVSLDEEALRDIAKQTGGEYFYAGNAPDLRQIYQNLTSKLALEMRETEVTALVAAVGALLVVLAGGLSMLWFNRVL
ncbi:VWA domain-containing protein [Caldimonas tepidiphila]|uniref:VWA domain-containing protein n=1 Tax=Caldimonas tepidiphila TaxID=2315841 RepID=UPI000E5B5C8A|nr:VWA domain-containing protein [Caldimonas tepidiphila]